jgi:hypothetical protein
VAQLGARLDGIEEVVGSNPIGSTKFAMKVFCLVFLCALFSVANLTALAQASSKAAEPQTEISSDPIAYLGSKIRVWSRDDAEAALGRSFQHQDAVDIQTSEQIGETLKFKVELAQYGEVDLTFDKDSRKLTVIYLVPKGLLTGRALRDALGKDFVKSINPNGTPSYVYQRPQRTISIQTDMKDDVANVMIW